MLWAAQHIISRIPNSSVCFKDSSWLVKKFGFRILWHHVMSIKCENKNVSSERISTYCVKRRKKVISRKKADQQLLIFSLSFTSIFSQKIIQFSKWSESGQKWFITCQGTCFGVIFWLVGLVVSLYDCTITILTENWLNNFHQVKNKPW